MIGVSAAADGALWGVDSAGFVYKLQQQPWDWKRNPTAKRVKEIAVGSEDQVWCRNSDGDVFKLASAAWDADWVQDDDVSDVQTISAGSDGTVWVGNGKGELFMRNGGGWEQSRYARNAEEVTTGDAGQVWYRDSAGKVHRLIGRDWKSKWQADTFVSQVQFISAASDGTVWVSSNDPNDKDRLYRRMGTNKWDRDASGKAIQGSVGASDKFYCVNAQGAIHRQKGSAWPMVYGPDLSDITARTHLVKKHETLGAIVQKAYQVSGPALTAKIKEVAAYNSIANPDRIDAGMEIVLP
jgi:hypothetical protein